MPLASREWSWSERQTTDDRRPLSDSFRSSFSLIRTGYRHRSHKVAFCAKRKRDSAQPQESTRLSSSSSYGGAYDGRAQCSDRRFNGIALAGASSNRRFHEVFSSYSSVSHNANPAQSTHIKR